LWILWTSWFESKLVSSGDSNLELELGGLCRRWKSWFEPISSSLFNEPSGSRSHVRKLIVETTTYGNRMPHRRSMEDDVPRHSYEYQWEPSLLFIGIFLFLVMGVLSLEVIVDSSRSVCFVFI
jgi:hypothetical protein